MNSGKALRCDQIGLSYRMERQLVWLEHQSQEEKDKKWGCSCGPPKAMMNYICRKTDKQIIIFPWDKCYGRNKYGQPYIMA